MQPHSKENAFIQGKALTTQHTDPRVIYILSGEIIHPEVSP